MKHFWVIFKLMLLLVFALRLLKSNRKVAKFEHDPKRGFFNLFQEKVFSEKIVFTFESTTPELQLKEIFRKIIRPKEENWKQNGGQFDVFFATLTLEERIIYIASIFNKSLQKGNISLQGSTESTYRFIISIPIATAIINAATTLIK